MHLLLGRTGGVHMSMKKKKTKKGSPSLTSGSYPAQQASLPRPSASQKPGPVTVGTSVGALLFRVKSYLISGKPAEA
jgi:hypothetical protein